MIRKRADIPVGYQWNLCDLYDQPGNWESDFGFVHELIPRLQAFSGTLSEPQSIRDCLILSDRIGELVERLYVYAHLKHHEDTAETSAQALAERAKKLMADVQEAASFVDPELLALPDDRLRWLLEVPELSFYRFTLENKLRAKPHTLPKEQEEILAKSAMMAQSPQIIYELLNDADMKFPSIRDETGADVEVTHARYGRLMESRDRRVRKDAFASMTSSYRRQQNTIAGIFNAHVQRNIFYSRVSRYAGALEMALFPDDIPRPVYENLITSIHSGLPVFHRYLRLRKRTLGLPDLRPYDLSVPLVPDIDWRIPYDEATETVTRALAPLGREYQDLVRSAWSGRWIDVYENEGKRSGGYSWGAYGVHPYILLNHEDTFNDMFTIAHEIGHAVHSTLADRHQAYRYAGYAIFIAEIASTLNEALLMRHLLSVSDDRMKRAFLLTHLADNYRSTVFIQTMFAEFELQAHQCAERGEPLTLSRLNDIYRSLHALYHGDELQPEPDTEIGWMRIPHFYQSFYVYKYATGFTAARSFAHRIVSDGDAGRYLDMLRSGGKDHPLNLLKAAGLDMSEPAPILEALSEFESVVGELEAILTPSAGR